MSWGSKNKALSASHHCDERLQRALSNSFLLACINSPQPLQAPKAMRLPIWAAR